jgi:hypothetical protein
VFICYSRKDKRLFLDRLLKHLERLEMYGLTEVWVDERIEAGERWREEIRAALAVTKVAVLLVSIDFITSDFIRTDELPVLLRAAEQDGVRVIPVVVQPCQEAVKRTPNLAAIKAMNNLNTPLSKLKYYQREEFWDRLAASVEDTLSGPA